MYVDFRILITLYSSEYITCADDHFSSGVRYTRVTTFNILDTDGSVAIEMNSCNQCPGNDVQVVWVWVGVEVCVGCALSHALRTDSGLGQPSARLNRAIQVCILKAEFIERSLVNLNNWGRVWRGANLDHNLCARYYQINVHEFNWQTWIGPRVP